MRLRMGWEMKILAFMLIVVFLLYFSFGYGKAMTWDEAAHSNAALFTYNAVSYGIQNPDLSAVKDFSIDYHMHYKVFNTVMVYTPFFYMVSVPAIALFGLLALTGKLIVIIEALVVLFFTFKIAKLYDRNMFFPLICVALLAMQPIFMDIATRNYLDMGLTMFMMGSFYFFVKFLREERRRDLYLTGIFLGLGVLAKPSLPIILVAMVLLMAWERKLFLIRRHALGFLKAFLVFLVFISPFIAQQGLIYMQCTEGYSEYCGLDKFLDKWTGMGGSTGRWVPDLGNMGSPVWAHDSHVVLEAMGRELVSPGDSLTDFQELTKNLSGFFFQWYLIPFFIIGFALAFRRRDSEIGRIGVLLFLINLYMFTVHNHVGSLKHIVIVMPFIVLLSTKGLFELFRVRRLVDFRWVIFPLVFIFLVLSLYQASAYNYSVGDYTSTADFEGAARYVLADADGRVSVLATYAPMQIFHFAMLDGEGKVYGLYIPRTQEELELSLDGDFSFAAEDLWESMNVSYLKPGYVIIHERRLEEKRFEYGLEYFTESPDFILLETLEGGIPGDRTFIFKTTGE